MLELGTANEILETTQSPKIFKLPGISNVENKGLLQNEMQQDALHTLLDIGRRLHESSDESIKRDWMRLQSLDHFLFMDSTAGNAFNPYESPYEAFLRYMNVLADFDLKISDMTKTEPIKTS